MIPSPTFSLVIFTPAKLSRTIPWSFFARLLMAIHALAIPYQSLDSAFAQESGTAKVTIAQWTRSDAGKRVSISLANLLTEKQRKMITGGFTTVSELAITTQDPREVVRENNRILKSVRCSVKYDAWEEYYDVALLAETPKTAIIREFPKYADLCLSASLINEEHTNAFHNGGILYAQLLVRQTSIDEANQIKDWLIKQQSGVMQTLFSHMLGELALSQALGVRVSVPPLPDGIKTPNVHQDKQLKRGRKG